MKSQALSFTLLLLVILVFSSLPTDSYAQDKDKAPTIETVTVRGSRINRSVFHLIKLDGGGSGKLSVNKGQQDKQEDAKDDDCKSKGNPINFSTGNKIEPEVDFSAEAEGESPLYLERTYNHYWKGVGIFGRHWVSNFDFILTFDSNSTASACYPKPGATNCNALPVQPAAIWAHRPDGRQIKFIWNANANAWLEDKAEAVSKIVKNVNGTFTLVAENSNIEIYSAYGRVLDIKNIAGIGWSFTYSMSNYLTQVTHTSGRSILFTWTGSQLTRVTDPAGNFYNYTYLANRFGAGLHLLSSTQLPGAPVTTVAYHYEDGRYLGGLTGKSFNGIRYSTFAYDSGKRAILSKHAGDVDSHAFVYTLASGQIATAKVTNPLGLQTTYTFINGDIASVAGAATSYCQGAYQERTYDINGNEDLVTDFENNITDFDYNAKGQLVKKTDAVGTAAAIVTDYEWDTVKNRVTKVTVAGVSETTTGYTNDNLVASITVKNLSGYGLAGNTRTTTYSYTRHLNNMLATVMVDGPLPGAQDLYTTQYNSSGDILSVSDALGVTTSFQNYNALGLPGRIVYRGGAYKDFVYDGRGRVTQVTNYLGTGSYVDTFTYDARGNVASRSNGGKSLDYQYVPGNNRLAAIVHSSEYDGLTTETIKTALTYNNNGDVTQQRSTRTAVQESLEDGGQPSITIDQLYSSFTDYDELGRVRAERGNGGQNFRQTYDREDRVKTSLDSFGNVSTNTYDALGRLTSFADTGGGVTQFEYNKRGDVTKIIDPRNLTTTYQHDGFGQLWSQSSPDTGSTSLTYDAYGRLTSQNRNGITLNFSLDSVSRIASVSGLNAQNTLNTRTFSYDSCTNGLGRLCAIGDGNGSWTHYNYTISGRVSSLTQFVQNAEDTSSFEYDAFNRLSKITYPNGEWVTYGYTNGQVSSINTGVGLQSLQIVASNFVYHPAIDLLASFSSGSNGQARMYNYDPDMRLASIQAPGIQGLSFGYNTNNEITSISNVRGNAYNQAYGYDNMSRLVTANNGDATGQSFTYDVVGNRVSHVQNGQITTLSYDTNSNRLTSSTKTGLNRSWIYNNVGNSNGFTGADGVAIGLSYDAFDRVNGSSRNGQTTYYTVNAIGQRIAKSGPSGNTRFIYGLDGSLLAENNNGIWTNYIRFNGMVIAMLKNGSTYYVYNDHLGRPEVVRNGPAINASTVWAAKNTAFDRTVVQNTLGEFNLGFPGQYFDTETGTWYNYFRDYDASTGRYVQSDPIGLKGGLNTFAYASSNPVSRVDPYGLTDWVGTALEYSLGPLEGTTYSLTSKCTGKGEPQLYVRVQVGAGGASSIGRFSAPVSYVGSNVTFSDNRSLPDPTVFNGSAVDYSIGISPGFGLGAGYTRLGDATSGIGWSALFGFKQEVGVSVGNSRVTSAGRIGTCKCENK